MSRRRTFPAAQHIGSRSGLSYFRAATSVGGAFEMRLWLRVLAVLCPLSIATSSVSRAADDNAKLTPIVAQVIAPPHLVPGSDGNRHIVYELALTNITGGNVRLEKLKIIDAGSGATLALLGPDDLAKRVTPGASRGHETRDLAAYQFAIIFLHVSLGSRAAVPAHLTHEVTAHFGVMGADRNAQ